MTARAPGRPSRGAAAPTRTSWTRDGVGAILAILALGLAFRVIIARENPGIGLSFDLASFRGWASDLATNGLYGFYARPGFHDYTPGYLYVLYLVGLVGKAMGGIGDLIKLPAMITDVALGWLVWSMVQELGGSRRAALSGAAIVVANPVSWFDSVVWGQVDSFGVVFLLLGVRALWRDQPERAAIWAVIAALVKPQLGILIPVVAIVTIRRALWPSEAPEPSQEPSAGPLERFRALERRTGAPIRIVTTGLAAIITTFALCIPFGLSVIAIENGALRSGLVQQIFSTAGGYPYVTVNAFNPWALVTQDGAGLAASRQWLCDVVIQNPVLNGPVCPTALQFGPVPAVIVGTALLLAAFALVCAVIARRPDRLTILVGVTVLAIAFFVLPTRVHERYLYPFFALGAILAAASWRWLVAYVALAAATFLNMYVVITTIYPDAKRNMVDWLGIGQAVRSQPGVTIIALTTLVAAVWAFSQLRAGAFESLEEEFAGEPDDPWDDVAMAGAAPAAAGFDGDAPPVGWEDEDRRGRAPPARPVAPLEPALPTWTERPSFAEVGLIEWLRSRLTERPIRADRSHDLHDEPTGRLDRLDLWFVAVVIVAILGLRMFRLAEPYQMHFDEVYHARTAAEFLQDWRYGISHEIYEWTHPHLAKYGMAGGLVAWGDDRVSATSQLGVPVVDALVEPRRDDPGIPGGRAGDRVHVVTGSALRSYDLEGRQLIFDAPVAGASALAIDSVADRLFIGTMDGKVLVFDLLSLDGVRTLETAAFVEPPQAFARVDGSIRMLYASDDGQSLFVTTDDDRLLTLDADSAEVIGSIDLEGVAGFSPGGTGAALSTLPGSVEDPAAVAAILADLLGGDAATYQGRMTPTEGSTIVAGIGNVDQRANIDSAIADGRLAGLTIEDVPRVAVATADGVTFLAAPTGDVVSSVELDGGAHGLDFVNVDDPKVYVSTGGEADGAPGEVAVIYVDGAKATNGPTLFRTIPLPGQGTRVAYDDATLMVHVLGASPDGAGSTIYVIEPHGDAVFADAKLPFDPTAWAVDIAKPYPTDDRQQILAFGADGDVASVELGKHGFAWRLPGVIAGALMAGLLYVLTRILFRRREIAVLVGVMVIADGMLFVQSRIGMNDAYVGLGIVAAYTLFAAIWTGAWRWRGAFWVAMPLIGFSLGFAFAAKWVALYTIGGIALLILARSALGRFLLIAGLIAITATLGHLAIVVPEGGGLGNLPFVAIMIGLTSVAVAVNILHPIAWSDDEMRFAIAAPAAGAAVVALGSIALGVANTRLVLGPVAATPLHIAAAMIALALLAYVAFIVAGRSGFGPLAKAPDPTDPAALLPPPAPPPRVAWLRPGALFGLPIAWMAVCLIAVPVGLYIVSYIPWALVEGHRLTNSWPPGNEGQTLADLTRQMYDYHNNLTAGHAASSPWWAWPFDLKPVWFYQEGFAGSTTAAIYDAGNLVIWWLGVPALGFVAWQAYSRRSLGLALIAIAFACQWVSWARIDRAAFQYHYYTSLPFVIMALAYFVAEIWHGASRRTWLLARISAAIAVMGPAFLWLIDQPLCGFVGVERAVPDSAACPPVIPEFVLTAQTFALAIVVIVAMVAFLYQLASLDLGREGAGVRQLLPLGITAVATVVGLWLVRNLEPAPIFTATRFPVEPIAAVGVVLLGFLAAFVATARDARRFVVGLVTAIVGWFLVVYPNISALPLPSVVANAYQGILPTYLYAFQFPSNRSAVVSNTPLIDVWTVVIGAGVVFLAIVLAYSAWVWRIAIAERDADQRAADEAAASATGSAG